jgi:hypothetical protein
LIGHSDLKGHGNGGQVTVSRRGSTYHAYVGHMKDMGTTILDVTDPAEPVVISQIPISQNSHSHKVRVCGDLILVNREQLGGGRPFEAGLKIYDVSDPSDPAEISFFETGGRGVHKYWVDCDERLAYISTESEGYLGAFFMIVDFREPEDPFEVSRWWIPGQWTGSGEEPTWDAGRLSCRLHHPVVLGERAYLGYWDADFVILDISDVEHPEMISRANYSPPYGGAFHTALPVERELLGRKWLVVFQESLRPYSMEGRKLMWMVDVTAEENPVPVSTFQVPVEGFSTTEGRFGPHQPHEDTNLKDDLVYASWFGGGLRIVNIANPYRPDEVGYYIPPTPKGQAMIQTNDVFVDDRGLVYIIDRLHGGLDILEYTGPR